jgi:prenyltransferase beta subunit
MDFLKTKMNDEGFIISASVTDWVAIAIASSGEDLSKWDKMKNYLITSVENLNQTRATDWERHCIAIVAFGLDPRNVSGIDLVDKIQSFYNNGQIGLENDYYDDIFGIIALHSCNIPYDDEIIQNSTIHLISKQNPDGGWGDVDTTAAAIIALTTYDSINREIEIQKALDYIKNQQTNDGGFYSWGSTNIASTSWVLCSLSSLYKNPNFDEWEKNDKTPIDFILDLQKNDGSFKYTKNSTMNPEWMTAYAIIALTGGTFYINP